jgi:hypothetical protein
MVEDIKQYEIQWLEHVERMSPKPLPSQANFYVSTGNLTLAN